ncbi:holin [Mycobacterium phage Sheen]|uniref:Holin n=1 Tax=Mycobacterium phage Sheen TaxID=1589274 RepID=A0A0B5A3L2_9CAUD|nr:holin [Mycobacterium phage Sheen]AJD82429.1 holin [Mycobacterium phage Sheen]
MIQNLDPRIAQTLYGVSTILSAVLGIALVWGGIDAGAAESIGDILVGFMDLLGITAPSAVATARTHVQRKDGTLDNPAERIVKDLTSLVQAKEQTEAALASVQSAVTTLGAEAPVAMGPLAQQAISNATHAWSAVNDLDLLKSPFDR